jgi:hypothetical protein
LIEPCQLDFDFHHHDVLLEAITSLTHKYTVSATRSEKIDAAVDFTVSFQEMRSVKVNSKLDFEEDCIDLQ